MEIIISLIALVIAVYILKKYMSGASFSTSGYDLTGKYAVITGGNSGIGKETVLELVRLNCNIIIGARDKNKSEQTVKQAEQILSKKLCKNTIIQHFYLDLGSKKSIDQFSEMVKIRFSKIDYLVNNAGLSLIPKKGMTIDGFQTCYGVNHLGHFYLTFLLMGQLVKSQFFRVINISSIGHRRILGFFNQVLLDWDNINFSKEGSYQQDLAYSRSKLCNVLFTKALAHKISPSKGLSLCLHPGVVRSHITRHVKLLQYVILILHPIYWIFSKNCQQGAQTIIYTILSNQVKSGQYYADCSLSHVNPLALDNKNWQKLWKISEQDLGIKFQIN